MKRNRGKKRSSASLYEGLSKDETPYQKLLGSIDFKQMAKGTLGKFLKTEVESKRNVAQSQEDIEAEVKEDKNEKYVNVESDEDKSSSSDVEEADNIDDDENDVNESESEDENDTEVKGEVETYKDPFKVHFENDIEEEAVNKLKEGSFDRRQMLIPDFGLVDDFHSLDIFPKSSYYSTLEEASLVKAKVKDKLTERWHKVNQSELKQGTFTELQNSLFNHINCYKDVFYSQRDFDNGEEIRKLYCLHAVNHILKTRSRILKSNAKIVQSQKDNTETPEFRDQGLARPKVLILVPFRDCALRIINLIIQLTLPTNEKAQVMNKKRFYDEFKDTSQPENSQRYMPDDFKAMFNGNTDDCFRIGITVMRRALKLFGDFYSSDIIVASPLGLRMIIGGEGEKKREYDFLSSIEVLIVDQADVFLMQNWEHVLDIFNHINLQPMQPRETDFSRVRMWALNSWSKLYRQTLLFSSFITPELNSVFNKYCSNYAGKVRIKAASLPGTVRQVVLQIPQVFHRIDCQSLENEADKRFDYFIKKVLPELNNPLSRNTAIFIPSYFDFVRIRNYFKKEELDFLQINEYSERSNISRARTKFTQKQCHFLLFTERFYFFYRYRIRGIRNIVFYQLPLYPVFFPEIINYMDAESSSNSTCTVLYSKFDSNRLEAITGTQKCKQIIVSSKNIHMIVAGN
ncbi:U3 small nucleolar RNA-associated protein 25 homolog [Rhopilema esculentum]|uniref:U3 small nucleolar RNA-associated protein 25 homolog n=1 Tax=Rhopilema esculentum TaxID=499914 RepID=UPI0031E36F10